MEFGKAKEFFSQKLNFFHSDGVKAAQEKITHTAANLIPQEAQAPQPSVAFPPPENEEVPAEAPPEQEEPAEQQPENMDVMVYDELLWANKYTYDEFVKSLNVKYQERGDTPEDRIYWSYRRRWRVRLYNLKIVNKMADSLTCFAEFDFGGTRSECSVQMGSRTCILNKGESKQYIRTPVVENVTKEMSRDFKCTNTFEYHGSYLDLEHEKLRIKLWKCRKYTINCLESVYEEYLVKYVKGDIFVEIPMYKFEGKEKKLRCTISFDLFFQELYDFELSFINWKVNGVKSSVNLFNRKPILQNEPDVAVKTGAQEKATPDEKSTDGKKGTSTDAKKGTSGTKGSIPKSAPANNAGRRVMGRPTKMNRIRYFIFRLKLRKKWKSESMDTGKIADKDSDALQMKSEAEMTEYERLLVKRNLLIKDDPYSRPEPEVPKKYLPSPKLRIRIKQPNSHRVGGLELISHVVKNESNAHWSNMGEVVFRGTLMDLQKSELEVCVLDAKAPNAVNCVGYTVVSLESITDYPFLISKLKSPNWLKLKANIEGWHDNLDKWAFGSIHGRVEIHRKPQYRQSVTKSASVAIGNSPILIVHIKAVDQLITDIELTSIDSFVEVSFAGQTYSTAVCAGLLCPFWNEEITFALTPPLYAGIDHEFFLRCGFIRISVWGYSSDLASGIIYFGSACLHPCEIFYTPKGEPRQKSQTTHYGYNSKYETRVFSGKRKLHLLQDDDRQANITFSAWIFPDHNIQSAKDSNLQQEILQKTQINMCGVNTETYKELENYWTKMVALRPGENRKVIHRAVTEYNEVVYLPCFVAPMHPPPKMDNENAIFHMIRCIPFTSKQFTRAYTPSFMMKIKRGHALDHAILFCSYLRGMIPPIEAYVCLGSTADKKVHAWVITLYRNTKTVKLWETTNGERYLLKDVFMGDEDVVLHSDEKYNSKIPYTTMDAIFNERNLWLNVQESLDPQYIFYNVERLSLFCPFMPKRIATSPCYSPKINYATMNKYELEKLNVELKNQIERSMNLHRTAQNLQTKWNNTPELQAFLVKGLKLVHTYNTCSDDNMLLVKRELQEWKGVLRKRVPQSYQLLGTALHFNTVDPEAILDPLRHSLECLDSREMSVTFSINTLTKSLPGDLYSVYLYVLYTCKVHERVRRTLAMKQERLNMRRRHKQRSPDAPLEGAQEDEDDHNDENEEDDDGGEIWMNSGMMDDDEEGGAEVVHADLVDKITRNLSIQNKQLTRKRTKMAGHFFQKSLSGDGADTQYYDRFHSSFRVDSFSGDSSRAGSIDPIISRDYSSKFLSFENLPSIDIDDLHSKKLAKHAKGTSSSSILRTILTSEPFSFLSTLGSQAYTKKMTTRGFSGNNAPSRSKTMHKGGEYNADLSDKEKGSASSRPSSSPSFDALESRVHFLESKSEFVGSKSGFESRNDFPASESSASEPPAGVASRATTTLLVESSSWSSSDAESEKVGNVMVSKMMGNVSRMGSNVMPSKRMGGTLLPSRSNVVESERSSLDYKTSSENGKPKGTMKQKLQNFIMTRAETRKTLELPYTETASEVPLSEDGGSVGRLDTVFGLATSSSFPEEETARLVSMEISQSDTPTLTIPSSSDFDERNGDSMEQYRMSNDDQNGDYGMTPRSSGTIDIHPFDRNGSQDEGTHNEDGSVEESGRFWKGSDKVSSTSLETPASLNAPSGGHEGQRESSADLWLDKDVKMPSRDVLYALSKSLSRLSQKYGGSNGSIGSESRMSNGSMESRMGSHHSGSRMGKASPESGSIASKESAISESGASKASVSSLASNGCIRERARFGPTTMPTVTEASADLAARMASVGQVSATAEFSSRMKTLDSKMMVESTSKTSLSDNTEHSKDPLETFVATSSFSSSAKESGSGRSRDSSTILDAQGSSQKGTSRTSSIYVSSDWDSSSKHTASSALVQSGTDSTLTNHKASASNGSSRIPDRSRMTSLTISSSSARSDPLLASSIPSEESSNWSSVKLSSDAHSSMTSKGDTVLKRPSKFLAEMLVKKVSMQPSDQVSLASDHDDHSSTQGDRSYKKVGVFGLFA